MSDIERYEYFLGMADRIKSLIDYIDNDLNELPPDFMAPARDALYLRYFKVRLKVLEYDPMNDLNQAERAQLIHNEREKIALSAKSLKAICRWDALKIDVFDLK